VSVAAAISWAGETAARAAPVNMKQQVDEFENLLIRQALARHGGEATAAAEELGIARRTLNEKMAKYGLARERFT